MATEQGASRDDILGLLGLLLSAEGSLQSCCPDPQCQQILAQCIADLRERHNVSPEEFDSRISWTEQSDVGLVRLLDYVRAEIKDTIKDAACAAALGECIERIMKLRGLSSERLFSKRAAVRGS